MVEAIVLAALIFLLGATLVAWRLSNLRRLALDRFESVESRARAERSTPRSKPLARRLWWIPWVVGCVCLCSFRYVVGWPLSVCVSLSLVIALLGREIEVWLAGARAAKIETQLADAIDIMVGALGAGAGVTTAMQAAIEETRAPLRDELEDTLARVRLGDNALDVFRSLATRVPLETFTLFSSALAIHWEVGGTLGPTLANVGRTIRDRIETSRRITSNITQSQMSTIFVILLTYFIAAIVWRNSPSSMEQFLSSVVGQGMVSTTILLQAIGIVWMNQVSRPRF